jgi:hypothetical protein
MSASARIEELKKRYDENPRRFFAPLANEYRKSGDLGQAIGLCETHLHNQQGTLNGYVVYGQALFDAGRLDESRTTFESALELDPENLIALRHLGDIARTSGDSAQARAWYTRVLDADPRNHEMLALLAGLPPAPSPQPRTTPAPPTPRVATPAAAMPDVRSAPTAPMPTPVPVATGDAASPQQGSPRVPTPGGAPPVATPPAGSRAAAPAAGSRAATPVTAEPPVDDRTGLLDLAIDLGTSAEGPAADATLTGFGEVEFMFSSPAPMPESPAVSPPSAGLVDVPIDLLFDDPPHLSTAETVDETPVASSPAEPETSAEASATSGPEHEASPASRAPEHEASLASNTPEHEASAAGAAPEHEAFTAGTAPQHDVSAERPEVYSVLELDAPAEVAALDAVPEYVDSDDAAVTGAGPVLTPALGMEVVSAVTETPSPFVTETMAELYLQQGFHEEGLAVYRQLLEQNPDDVVLRERVRDLEPDERSALSLAPELEQTAPMDPVAASDVAHRKAPDSSPADRTARQFFSALAARRAIAHAASGEPASSAGGGRPESGPQDSPEGVVRGGSLDALFGDASVGADDERMALSLAHMAEMVEPQPGIRGRPTQPASTELSLDAVFRESSVVIPGVTSPLQRHAGFDDFFSGATGDRSATPADVAAAPPVTTEAHGTAELEQFQDWLQQLKKP